jgi:hypothetical protein
MPFLSFKPRPIHIDIFLSYVMQLLFNYSSITPFLSYVVQLLHLFCLLLNSMTFPLAVKFVIWHPHACCLTLTYNLPYGWAHVLQFRFIPMHLHGSIWKLVWKLWWKRSPTLAIATRVQATMYCVLTCFPIVFQITCSIVEPNSTIHLANLSSFSFFLHAFHFLCNYLFHCFFP